MKVQKFEGLTRPYQTFKSKSNNMNSNSNKRVLFDIDSAESAAATDSIDSPFFPQLIRKIQKSFNIVFPKRVVKEAENIDSSINSIVENNHKFQAVA